LLLAILLGWLWLGLCHQLSYEWSANEQYRYGWFVPFFAAFLFWLRFEERPKAKNEGNSRNDQLQTGSGFPHRLPNFLLITLGFLLLTVLLPIRLFEIANPDWRPLSWGHASLVVGFTLLVIGCVWGRKALGHFAFPICFILVAVPWLTPMEAPLVQGLMRLVATIATELLTLLGIPAQLDGSLIQVGNGIVGVSEACSGVRSLQTSLMIGLLCGELKRFSLGRRIALVAAALAIAFLANCGRTFFLVWIAATQNLAAVERWHDIAGYAIVVAVSLGTIAFANAIAEDKNPGESGKPRLRSAEAFRYSASHVPLPIPFLASAVVFLLVGEVSVNSWYRWHERKFIATPRWTVQWPNAAPGFHDLPIDDGIESTLRANSARQAAWHLDLTNQPNEIPAFAACSMFFFRWEPGSASILRARAHRPDICLPKTGWETTHDDGAREYHTSSGLSLPFRHFEFVRRVGQNRRIFAHAFFCQREDRVPARAPDQFDATTGDTGNWMRGDRMRVVMQGLRNQGQQVMELVFTTPREVSRATAEKEFAALLPQLIKNG
jgi:exosortase